MSSEKSKKSKKSNKIVTHDPTLKLSRFKKFQIRFNIKKEHFSKFRKENIVWKFYVDMISDIFNYSLVSIIIMIPFSSQPIIMGLSIGAAIWLYINRIHGKLKEILGSVTLVNNIKYGK